MITISLSPFCLRRLLAAAATIIGLSCASAFGGQPMLRTVNNTPYDRQMSRITPILQQATAENEQISLQRVNSWMTELRAIPYGFSMQWKTPDEVATGSYADCKGKSVALYQRMKNQGAQNVRLVIGKKSVMSRSTHAWLEWTTPTGTYLLDPTIHWSAVRANVKRTTAYIPFYAYAGSTKYRATGASYFFATTRHLRDSAPAARR